MDIGQNFALLIEQITKLFTAFFNKTLILACSAQLASMVAKFIISSIKNKKIAVKEMATYGGMPSSHTTFIMAYVFGVALDPKIGWTSEIFTFGIVVSAMILMDAIRFRGTVDKINEQTRKLLERTGNTDIIMPKYIAHKASEVVGGVIFAFLYTFTFYLFFYNLFP
ncbi:MAG TPA: divergent PAP2 family protein [Spirochaetota bacterium]|nr:divergent PAP2 family protein [Spirochaetota bacterium]HOS32754.1 divergent PAP2 family protein [Spirochaetota bacterium]HOS55279.1 divergent PAP2 family protein [Spirochaetota bacterium]HPK62347.1 divergent PAP2 family protein [Spirochaetota bacterium]HQF77846.1 divergent PAP2 family protein [Spirochaetota bacterium]